MGQNSYFSKKPTMYHCYFSYFETETKSQRRVNTTKSWNYPNLKAIMKDLKNRWIKERVPLTIKQDLSGKVKISHEMPSSMGSLAQLKLSPNLKKLEDVIRNLKDENKTLKKNLQGNLQKSKMSISKIKLKLKN